MNYIKIIIFFTLLVADISYADVGDPTVQAVCRVTLINGKTVEGLIKIGSGGYNGLWMNGFNVETNYKQQISNNQSFFDLNFRYIQLNDTSIAIGNSTSNLNGAKVRVRYLQWVENPSIYEPVKYITTEDSLVITKHIERHYLFLDSIAIFMDMSSVSFLDTIDEHQKPPRQIKVIKIATKDIAKFELVEFPSQEWLSKIEIANRRFDELFNGENSSGDGKPAMWFHDMVAKKELYDYFQPRIDFYIGQFPK